MTKYTIEEAYIDYNNKYLVKIRVDRQNFNVILLAFDHWPNAEEIDTEFKKEELKLKEFLND